MCDNCYIERIFIKFPNNYWNLIIVHDYAQLKKIIIEVGT